MPRITEITVPSGQTTGLLQQIKTYPGIISIRTEKGISVQPPGDVVTVALLDKALPGFMGMLDELGVTRNPACSVTTTRPMSLISSSSAQSIRNDSSHSIWEEIDQEINKESSMTPGTMAVMAISGIIMVASLMTNALHLAIAAMVIAPGFEPITRFALGIVGQSSVWKTGLVDFVKGYIALILGALIASFILQQWGFTPAETQATYLSKGTLLSYWTSTSTVSIFVSLTAALAGAMLVIGQRAVLTSGVMIALALVPAAAILGIGIATMDMNLIRTSLMRFSIEVLLVASMSLLVFLCKRIWTEKRKMSL